jgi:hypothetical protein
MVKVRSWAGLDVHARSVLAVTLDAESGELRSARLPGEAAKVVEFLVRLPGPTRDRGRGRSDGVRAGAGA